MPITNLLNRYTIQHDVENGLVVTDPATNAHIASVLMYDDNVAHEIITQADTARIAWAARPAKERSALLRRWYDAILEHKESLAAIATAECGKPLAESLGEVLYAASFVEWFAEEAKRAYGEIIPSFADGKRVLTIKQPVGTCVAITPWNFPLAMITRKVAPALAAGCAMVVKPAEATPLSALALEYLAHQAGLPRDLFRVVPTSNPAAMGALFCGHPRVRKLSFTGSTAVGKILMRQAAGRVLRVSMELGGNAPFIVFDDADIDAAIDGVMISKFRNAGQTCVCTNRILVQDAVYDAFVLKLTARTNALKMGHGAEAGTQIGPLISPAARLKVANMVNEAVADGAVATTGGGRVTPGSNFYPPTILTNIDQRMSIANVEIFGPVAPVIRFETEADAIRIANDTPYGLAAYFYARDVGRIWRVMEALEFGMIGVNEGAISSEVAPFGGIKESGIGREGSRHGLDEYLELKYCLMGGLAS